MSLSKSLPISFNKNTKERESYFLLVVDVPFAIPAPNVQSKREGLGILSLLLVFAIFLVPQIGPVDQQDVLGRFARIKV